jgi:hypothetical protein
MKAIIFILSPGKGLIMQQSSGTCNNCIFRNHLGQVLNIYGGLHLTNAIFEDNNCQTSQCVYYSAHSSLVSGNITGSQFIRNSGSRIIEYDSVVGNTLFSNNILINNTLNSPSTEVAVFVNSRITINYNIFDNPDIIMQVIMAKCNNN